MRFKIACLSDIGRTRDKNQDAFLIEEADSSQGRIVLSVVCDGMGGFQEGELASATMIKAFQKWFHEVLPKLTTTELDVNQIRTMWDQIIYNEHKKMYQYAKNRKINMGTTLVATLITEKFYLIVNIGDSRTYLIDQEITQITKDHTYVQRALDHNEITIEEAQDHPRQNQLLQCIGAAKNIEPDYYSTVPSDGDMVLLCTDGFRHKISAQKIKEILKSDQNSNEILMKNNLEYITNYVKEHGEKDNITSVLIKISK